MQIEPALLGPVSLFLGAVVGGSTSLFGTIYSQRIQGRVQRVAFRDGKTRNRLCRFRDECVEHARERLYPRRDLAERR